MVKNFQDRVISFYRIHERDGQTDTHTRTHRHHMMA